MIGIDARPAPARVRARSDLDGRGPAGRAGRRRSLFGDPTSARPGAGCACFPGAAAARRERLLRPARGLRPEFSEAAVNGTRGVAARSRSPRRRSRGPRAGIRRGAAAGAARRDRARPFPKTAGCSRAGRVDSDRWAAVLRAIAILMPKTPPRNPHDRTRPFGAALFAAGVSELQLDRLLTAQGQRRRELITSACRRLAARRHTRLDLWPLVRWPRALIRSTQKPVSGLWKVTRSTRPASTSRSGAVVALTCGPCRRWGTRSRLRGIVRADASEGTMSRSWPIVPERLVRSRRTSQCAGTFPSHLDTGVLVVRVRLECACRVTAEFTGRVHGEAPRRSFRGAGQRSSGCSTASAP